MFDEEAIANRWIMRLVKLAAVAGAVLLAGWWLTQMRPPRVPPKPPPAQQVAVMRNRSENALARRVAAEGLEDADAAIVDQLPAELSSADAVGREVAAIALGRLDVQDAGAVNALIAALDGPEIEVRQQAANFNQGLVRLAVQVKCDSAFGVKVGHASSARLSARAAAIRRACSES